MVTCRYFSQLFRFVSLSAALLISSPALCITVEVAKKCNLLLEKEFPPRQPANPAAGSAKGSGQAQRDFFKKCVDNNGNMEASSTDKSAK